ncbi:unnamed protein product [Clonostachys rosea]|uniref:Enoyl reductase (ER) domain-containing protein n=1 Tax=Bionectria ochroleuca TaxID=29856 RepID=A0ABY6U355_BIOOC|nr:unnamed protein product [Clonostachys rosea]
MSWNTSPTPDKTGRWIVSEFGGPSVMKWETWDLPTETSPDDVLVRIIAAGISGTDNIQRVGGYPDPRTAKPGFTPGYELVGEVITIGSSAAINSKLAVGDRVVSMCVVGAHATHAIVPVTELIPIEATDDPVLVSALPVNYMTAWGMLKRSGVDLAPGSSVLIGSVSGGVGTAIAQLAHAFNMKLKLIGTCSASKFDYVKSLGVTPVDRRAPDLVAQVKALTDGKGVDVAYDAVGSEQSLLQSYQATKEDTGKVIMIGVMDEIKADGTGMTSSPSELHALLGARMQPRTSFFSVMADHYLKSRDMFLEDFNAILRKVRTKELIPKVFKVVRLADEVQVQEELVSGANVTGKMVFAVDEKLAKQHGL